MQCPHCGTEVIEGNRFCQQCRKRVAAADAGEPRPIVSAYVPSSSESSAPGPAPAYAAARMGLDMRRPSWVTVVAILDFVFGGLILLLGALMIVGGVTEPRDAFATGLGVFLILFGGFAVVTGIGLIRLQGWARIAQLILSGIGLLQIPCGTLVGAFVLFYLLKPGLQVLFSGRDESQLTPREAQDVAALTAKSSGGGGGTSMAVIVVLAVVVPLVLVAVIGIVAAIAIPSLLRARVAANEAGAIGDTRAVLSAQVAYQLQNAGRYGTLECLAKPATCLTAYAGPSFLDEGTAAETKYGYHRRMVVAADGSRYAYTSVPVTVGSTGTRSFCGDETGQVCQEKDGGDPITDDGLCDKSRCQPL